MFVNSVGNWLFTNLLCSIKLPMQFRFILVIPIQEQQLDRLQAMLNKAKNCLVSVLYNLCEILENQDHPAAQLNSHRSSTQS